MEPYYKLPKDSLKVAGIFWFDCNLLVRVRAYFN